MIELTNEKYISVSEVAAALNVDKATITRAIKKLDAVLSPLKNSQGGYCVLKTQN